MTHIIDTDTIEAVDTIIDLLGQGFSLTDIRAFADDGEALEKEGITSQSLAEELFILASDSQLLETVLQDKALLDEMIRRHGEDAVYSAIDAY